MSNIYVFEDKGSSQDGVSSGDITPSSELLLSSYNGKHFRFLCGSRRVYPKLCNIMKHDEASAHYVVFYDVSPNNINTINGFRDLVFRCKGLHNVTIIPIICIEYYIIKLLLGLEVFECKPEVWPFVAYLVYEFNWAKFLTSYADGKYAKDYWDRLSEGTLPKAIKSLEKSYKHVLENQLRSCLINSSRAGSNWGLFYTSDCNCDKCRFKGEYTQSYKAEYLVFLLPLASIVSKNQEEALRKWGITVKMTTIIEAWLKQVDFYNKLTENMGVTSIFNSDAFVGDINI